MARSAGEKFIKNSAKFKGFPTFRPLFFKNKPLRIFYIAKNVHFHFTKNEKSLPINTFVATASSTPDTVHRPPSTPPPTTVPSVPWWRRYGGPGTKGPVVSDSGWVRKLRRTPEWRLFWSPKHWRKVQYPQQRPWWTTAVVGYCSREIAQNCGNHGRFEQQREVVKKTKQSKI